jgi:hypothetical protein
MVLYQILNASSVEVAAGKGLPIEQDVVNEIV